MHQIDDLAGYDERWGGASHQREGLSCQNLFSLMSCFCSCVLGRGGVFGEGRFKSIEE